MTIQLGKHLAVRRDFAVDVCFLEIMSGQIRESVLCGACLSGSVVLACQRAKLAVVGPVIDAYPLRQLPDQGRSELELLGVRGVLLFPLSGKNDRSATIPYILLRFEFTYIETESTDAMAPNRLAPAGGRVLPTRCYGLPTGARLSRASRPRAEPPMDVPPSLRSSLRRAAAFVRGAPPHRR